MMLRLQNERMHGSFLASTREYYEYFGLTPDKLEFAKNDNFWDEVRKWQNKGWEIVQHGYTHIYDKLCKKKSDYL